MGIKDCETLKLLASVVFREYSFLELNVVCGFNESIVNGALVLRDYEYSFPEELFLDKTLWPSYDERTLFIPVIYNLNNDRVISSIIPLSVYVQNGFELKRLEPNLELRIIDYASKKLSLLVDNAIYFDALKSRKPNESMDKTVIKDCYKE